PLHPTQIYMIVGLVAATLLLKWFLNRKPPFDGAVGLGYLFLYGIVRFTVEIFRGDSERSVFGMTVSQAISLALILGSLTVFAAIMAGRPKMADVSGGAGEETPGTIPERTGEDGE
ncbi:MAG: phosphatidylglycerol---prolipoprotein diacylglyceryl transferase, partial [Candidatus Hydrogenedentes bacterium]|nr:phosphatidylglycerol---prolipoprotein diacylglyceryl transferase [Candidatus Hydrogenedentota bacterium]